MNIRTALALLILVSLSACATASKVNNNPDKQAKLANIHYQLGIDALGKAGMLPKAFDELMKSNEILPNRPEVLDALAYAWLLRGDMKKSEDFYLRAIHHDAGAATFNNYANLLNRLKRYPEAEKSARKALADPRYTNQDLAFINLGDALLGQEKFDAAIRAYLQARVFNSASALVNLRLAHAYFKHGKLRESRALYEIIIRKQNDNRQAVEGLVSILEQQNETAAARQVLNRFGQQTASSLDRAWALGELNRFNSQ
ncbi:MAG: tetratricopeptide repeat protein [Mariprofundus sp.]|nr:tetratricopeptide repeat protein [Mariprofundus sp.]